MRKMHKLIFVICIVTILLLANFNVVSATEKTFVNEDSIIQLSKKNTSSKNAPKPNQGVAGSSASKSTDTSSTISLNTLETEAGDFINKGSGQAGKLSGVTNSITSNFSGIGSILTTIGAGVMVAVVTYMGIKYLISPPDKQAALKQQLVGVVVAGIVIFGAYGIWSLVLDIVSNF